MNDKRRPRQSRLAEAADDTPHYYGHRERLRQRLIAGWSGQSAGLRAARGDPVRQQPARRRQAAGQGSARAFRRLCRIAERRARRARWRRPRPRRHRRAQSGARGGAAPDALGTTRAAGGQLVGQADRLLHRAHRPRQGRGVPHSVSRPQERADHARTAAARHGRPYAGLHPRGRQTRARAPGVSP